MRSAVLAASAAAAAWACAAAAQDASASPAGARAGPDVLSAADAGRYRRIFALQEAGDWRAARRLVRELGDRILMGHVLAQRYLHPTKYRSRYDELARWMAAYADHPDARRIHRLAMRRKPLKSRPPRRPAERRRARHEPYVYIENSARGPDGAAPRRMLRKVRAMVRRERLTAALAYASRPAARKVLGTAGYDLARVRIASGWFFYGNAAKALALARAATRRSGRLMPYGHWIAGLSAYRLGRHGEAAAQFEAAMRSDRIGGWDRAAAAFWAARASLKAGRPERVAALLRTAAAERRTFYGLLARRWLGEAPPFDWRLPPPRPADWALVRKHPEGRRALALIQAGRPARAGRELDAISGAGGPGMLAALAAVSGRFALPALSLKVGAALAETGDPRAAAALYPVPAWRPGGGFRVDRALVFAFMRQESAFRVRVRSAAGAMGLMQLMPSTASYISKSKRRYSGRRRHELYDPVVNMSLGQKYLRYLLENEHVRGDLLLAAAAYNGGPGNLRKWRRKAKHGRRADTLMFIESMPSRETRIFVERVLSNLWMYRDRFGEPSPSLDALAAGGSPIYESVEGARRSGGNVRN